MSIYIFRRHNPFLLQKSSKETLIKVILRLNSSHITVGEKEKEKGKEKGEGKGEGKGKEKERERAEGWGRERRRGLE